MRSYRREIGKSLSGSNRPAVAVVLLAFSLGAAACGTSESSNATFGQSVSTVTTGDDGHTESSSKAQSSATDSDNDNNAAAAGDHLFQDIEVLSVHTGETLNIAEELAGGTGAVLLWFWAPH